MATNQHVPGIHGAWPFIPRSWMSLLPQTFHAAERTVLNAGADLVSPGLFVLRLLSLPRKKRNNSPDRRGYQITFVVSGRSLDPRWWIK